MAGLCFCFFALVFIFSLPLRSDRGRFSRLLFFSSLSLLLFVFFGCSDGMEREACVCDHGYERSDLCAEIIIIIIIIPTFDHSSTLKRRPQTSVTAADLVWVCAPPRTIRKWLRRLAFGSCGPGCKILAAAAADLGGLRPAADHPQMVTMPGVLDPADQGARSLQLLLQTWCGSAPRRGPSTNGYDAWRLDPADPGARSLQLLLQTWCGSAPRRGPSANGYDAWRFGSADPRARSLQLRIDISDKVDEKVDNSGWRIKIVAECWYTHQIVGQKWVPGGALLSRGRVWPVDVPETSCKSMPTL